MSTVASEVAEDYKNSLSDLVNNSKPQITFLTILAEESKEHAGSVVDVIVEHAYRVDASKKLPCLYLIDSIIKNVKGDYIKLFQLKIHTLFPHIFEKVDEKVRRKMYELRQTWNDYFRKSTLYQLDVKVQALDPAWPVTAPTPSAALSSTPSSATVTSKQPVSKVFVNPSFVKGRQSSEELELLKLKREKMKLEEERQKILDYEQAKLKVRTTAGETAAKPLPEKKTSSTHSAPISRSELLKSYKVKKKGSAPTEAAPPAKPVTQTPPVVKEKPVSRGSNIHVDSRKATNVISPLVRKPPASSVPPVVASKTPPTSTTTTASTKPPSVAKESEPSNRDPRTIKLAVFSKTPKPTTSPTDKTKDKSKGKGVNATSKSPREKPVPDQLFKPDPVTKAPSQKIKMDLNTVDVSKNSAASSRDPRMKTKERPAVAEPKKDPPKPAKESIVKEDPKPVKSKEERMKEIKNELKKSEKKLSSSRREDKTSSPKKDDKSSSHSPRKSTSPKSSNRSRESKERKKSDGKPRERESSTKRKEEQTVKATTEKLPTATDSFKRIDKGSHQKRNWRHRPTPSPEAMEVEQPVVEEEEKMEQSPLEDVDSDESDHYEGNKPKVSTFSDKRASSGDVDLRMMSNTSDKPPINDLLFGSEDVDLRLFSASTATPSAPSLPAAFQAPITSAGGFEDTDFRKSIPKADDGSTKATEDMDTDNSFKTAPDLNSWDKFREKNPEFKEYQRQRSNSSTSDSPSVLSAEVSKNKAIIRRKIFDDDNAEKSDVTGDSDEIERQKLGLKQIAEQAEEQLQLGNITLTQYNNTLKNVVSLHYKQTNRSQSVEPEEGHPLPPPNIPFGGRGRGFHRGSGFRPGAPRDPAFTEWPKELPMMQPMEYRMVQKESETRRIAIDGKPREIRTYGTTAVLLMDNFEPRTVSFQPGTCNIVFDEGAFVMTMATTDDYKPVTIDGETHRVKLGVPTQELYIDDRGYQCFFGGKPVSIHLAGRSRLISLRGKPPNVSVSKEKNTDFLLGKVLLTVEGETRKVFPMYLDAKPQSFQAEGVPLILKFIDKFTAVKINTISFPVSFGGTPVMIRVRDGMKVFLKFSGLPPHIVPGVATVKAMDQDTLMPNYYTLKPTKNLTIAPPPAPPQLPLFPAPPSLPPTSKAISSTPIINTSVPPPKIINDKAEGVIPGAYNTNEEDKAKSEAPAVAPAPIDVSSLLATLVKVGIIGQKGPIVEKKPMEMAPPPPKKGRRPVHEAPMDENDEDWVEFTEGSDHPAKNRVYDISKMDYLFKSKQLRKRSSTLVSAMYRGIQCTNCGLRFSTDQTEQYSEHLDWHFRQNKKELDKNKKIFNRKFYLTLEDWNQYEEIEDIEERVPSIFEEACDKSRNDSTEEHEESVAVSADDAKLGVCPVCTDTFTQFFQHDTDEWHYRNAVHREELNYHPTCYSDLVKQREKREEDKIKAEEKRIEDEKKAEEERIVEEKRIEEEKIEEEKRIEDEKIAEEKRIEDEKIAEEKVKAEEKIAEDKKEAIEKKEEEDNINAAKKEEEEKAKIEKKTEEKVNEDKLLKEVSNQEEEDKVVESLSKIVVDETSKENEETQPNEEKEKGDAEKEVKETDKEEEMQVDEATKKDVDNGELEKSDESVNKNSEKDDVIKGTENNKEKDESQEKEISEPPKKKSKKKKEKKPVEMIDHTPIQIKTEPIDPEEVMETFCTEQLPTPGIWPSIKEEKDDIEETVPEESARECDESVHNEEESMIIDTMGDNNGTSHLMVASMDGNVVQNEAPDINPLSGTGPRIRISGALRMAVNKNNNENRSPERNGIAEIEDVDAVTILDDDDVMEWDEFTPPPFSANTEAHPSFVGKEIIDQGIRRAGIEDSGLCSIM